MKFFLSSPFPSHFPICIYHQLAIEPIGWQCTQRQINSNKSVSVIIIITNIFYILLLFSPFFQSIFFSVFFYISLSCYSLSSHNVNFWQSNCIFHFIYKRERELIYIYQEMKEFTVIFVSNSLIHNKYSLVSFIFLFCSWFGRARDPNSKIQQNGQTNPYIDFGWLLQLYSSHLVLNGGVSTFVVHNNNKKKQYYN